jgi:hypothetical protein
VATASLEDGSDGDDDDDDDDDGNEGLPAVTNTDGTITDDPKELGRLLRESRQKK